MKVNRLQTKWKALKILMVVFIILIGSGCAHLSGSTAGKAPDKAQEVDRNDKRTHQGMVDVKSKSKWDVILDQLGFWIRWIPTDIIIFP